MRTIEPKTTSRSERGSALLITLMVMVGLSLLGLGFVSISETESQISVNERNYAQTLAIAEAGAKTVVEWFQNPDWAVSDERKLMPKNSDLVYPNGIKRLRKSGTYTGVYRPVGNKQLFDRPYFPQPPDRFYGTEAFPDIQIDGTSAAAFLQTFNSRLFRNLDGGEITEIKIYAPPIQGGTVNADGFHEGSVTRFGVATVKVTAQKYRDRNANPRQVIAERTVKLVLTPWPFPGPQGPIQSNANLHTGGNFGVHWGKMTSQGTMEVKLPLISLPWHNAHHRARFEVGYPGGPAPTGNAADDFMIRYNHFAEVVDRSYEDPWYEARARQAVVNAIIPKLGLQNDPTPFAYDKLTVDIMDTPTAGWSNWLQLQAYDLPNEYKQVIFPKIDYDFWKEIAVQASASGQDGVWYLWPTGPTGEMYTDGSITKNVAQWTNTARATNPARAGFYFFDTVNRLNPQGEGAPGQLAGDVTINSSDDGNTFQMQGFIYLNARVFGTTGIDGPSLNKDRRYNAPGEPFRDIGYQRVDPLTGDPIVGLETYGKDDGEFSYQDINDNKLLDVAVKQYTMTRPANGGVPVSITVWAPIPYSKGCGTLGTDCSEPHEPYLNVIYNVNAKSGNKVEPFQIAWQKDNVQTRRPKARKDDGSLPNCNQASDQPLCTSNSFDRNGAFVSDLTPILDGVFYNEGDYDTQGNAVYFGSLLINGKVFGTGTPEVWFDEKLIKGDWPPKTMAIPNVYVSSHQTDQ